MQIRQLQEQIQSIQLQDLDDKIHRHVDRKLSKIHKTNMQYISMYASVKGVIEEIKLAYVKYDINIAKLTKASSKVFHLIEKDTVTPFVNARLEHTKNINDRLKSSYVLSLFLQHYDNTVKMNSQRLIAALAVKGIQYGQYKSLGHFEGVKLKENNNDDDSDDDQVN